MLEQRVAVARLWRSRWRVGRELSMVAGQHGAVGPDQRDTRRRAVDCVASSSTTRSNSRASVGGAVVVTATRRPVRARRCRRAGQRRLPTGSRSRGRACSRRRRAGRRRAATAGRPRRSSTTPPRGRRRPDSSPHTPARPHRPVQHAGRFRPASASSRSPAGRDYEQVVGQQRVFDGRWPLLIQFPSNWSLRAAAPFEMFSAGRRRARPGSGGRPASQSPPVRGQTDGIEHCCEPVGGVTVGECAFERRRTVDLGPVHRDPDRPAADTLDCRRHRERAVLSGPATSRTSTSFPSWMPTPTPRQTPSRRPAWRRHPRAGRRRTGCAVVSAPRMEFGDCVATGLDTRR